MLKKNDSYCLYIFIKKYNFVFIVFIMFVVELFDKLSVKIIINYINKIFVWFGY